MDVSLIVGGKHEDARGMLRFCNDFDMSAVKRFYTIANSPEQPRRGWIGHKQETKWFFPLAGKTTILIEPMEDGSIPRAERVAERCPSRGARSPSAPLSYPLDAAEPKVLCVPPGHWFLIDQSDGSAEVQVFSNCKVGEFPNDDLRK